MDLTSKKAAQISRRAFLQWSAAGLASSHFFLSGNGLLTPLSVQAQGLERIIPTSSNFDCGGRCLSKAHVLDGVITRISARANEELNPAVPVMKSCVRGRSYRKYQYQPDRLKYPMKRMGKRGEGKFGKISWEEAIETIAGRTKRLTDAYGPGCRFLAGSSGTSMGVFDHAKIGRRFFNVTGGFLDNYHNVSLANALVATTGVYGTGNSGNSMDSLLESKLIILWGHNPVETHFGHTNYYLKQAREKGVRIIVIDPRYSDSAVTYADLWIPVLPNTDGAMMDAMAYAIVSENLHDKHFLDTFCLGFDEEHMPEGVPAGESYLAYLMGKKDGVVKTPAWAERICKVPANAIRKLAIEYASAKPAALLSGWGPQRNSAGERTVRGSAMLCCMTGNVGKLGGWAGGYAGISRPGPVGMPIPKNPLGQSINIMQWTDAVEDHTSVTPADGLRGTDKLTAPVKVIYSLSSNYLVGMNPDINKAKRLLEDETNVEFIVASDLVMNSSCLYADILLPSVTFFECWDLTVSFNCGAYFILSQKVVEPMFEARHPYEWMAEVAKRFGVEESFTEGRTQEGWIRFLLKETRKKYPDVPEWEQMKQQGIAYLPYETPAIAFKNILDDPEKNKFPTASGKIELCSKALYDLHDPEVPAVAQYVPAWEGPEDRPRVDKYPFQVIGWKTKNRDNSTLYTHPWLQQVASQVMWLNPLDARKKGIRSGDKVRVFNDRGALLIEAMVTPRIMPGVLAIPTGAWHSPGKDGTDRNGCLNVLTTDRKTPQARGNAHHSCLADIARA
ncbi:MAG: molybdopterin-dependent oxidoreductase [Desulfovibrio sp.]|jgi:anaerobic dimethyl sulfoxide reductase subunit A|nr:molybdopterin-dependent oxidoreductase [Desulfovibrio sp.]